MLSPPSEHIEWRRPVRGGKGHRWRSRARRRSSSAAHRAWRGPRPRCWPSGARRSRSSTCRRRRAPRWPRPWAARFHPVDVTDDEAVELVLAEVVDALGGLHIAVNTAGGGIAKRTLTKDGPHPLDDFRGVIELNLIATFNLNRLQAFHMCEERARGRRARASSSTPRRSRPSRARSARSPTPRRRPASPGMALTMARDLGSLGIRVVAIAPSLFSTGITEGSPTSSPRRSPRTPRSRSGWAAPRSTARLAVAIVETPMLNGSCIRLDAGQRFAPK